MVIGLLAGLVDGDAERAHAPLVFDLCDPTQEAALATLVRQGHVRSVHDHIDGQLRELVVIQDPAAPKDGASLQDRVRSVLGGTPPERYGRWVYYPWTRSVVHVLPRDAFRQVRSSRNRHKITQPEQDALRAKSIGVVGLSVGHIIATTLALEGVGGTFRLADFDDLELSNTNRIPCGLAGLGVNKAVLAARKLFEIDPYLSVEVFDEGYTEENAESFLTGNGPLDLVVEECDSLAVKMSIRERARALRIPVVMETNDRGMIDIERFDLEPERPIFHGLLEDVSRAELAAQTDPMDKVPYVIRIVGGQDNVPTRIAATMFEIDESVTSWPQLGSDTTLGGALVTHVARRILLNQIAFSGRFYTDLCQSIDADNAFDLSDLLAEVGAAEAPLEPDLRALQRSPSRANEIGESEVREIVRLGLMAPSGGNIQPWRFHFTHAAGLACYVDPARAGMMLDFEQRASQLALGAAVENMRLAAAGLGFDVHVQTFPDPTDPLHVCQLRFSRAATPSPPPLLAFVPLRATNRKRRPRRALDASVLEGLQGVAADRGARLQFVTAPEALADLGEILAHTNRVQMFSKRMHGEMMSEIRWTNEQAERTRDGFDLPTFEANRAELAGFRMLASWRVMDTLRRVGSGRALDKMLLQWVDSASALGLLTIDRADHAAFFDGGQAMQTVWLEATRQNLAFQPISAGIYLYLRLEVGGGAGFTAKEIDALTPLRARFKAHFDLPDGCRELLLFRLSVAEPPEARSLRRTVDDVLTVT